jgi:hypothetical protein
VEVEFDLDEADLIALAKYRVEHSPAFRRRYRRSWIGISVGLGLLGVLIYALLSLKAPGVYLVAFSLFFLVSYPYYYRWLVGRTMHKIVNARLNSSAFARRTLRVTPEGLEMVTAGTKLTKSWDKVNGIEVTPAHAFFAIDGEYAIVVPRAALGAERFQRLMECIWQFAKFTRAQGTYRE